MPAADSAFNRASPGTASQRHTFRVFGPPEIMVVGAFNTRSTIEPLARAIAGDFSA
jgi:hypothetical protein